MVETVCFYCQAREASVCEYCGLVAVCEDPQHQLIHRPDGACLPFTVRQDKVKGNIIVAARDIKPFETILIDSPAIVGPFDDSLPECPECYRKVSVNGYKVRQYSRISLISVLVQ